MSGCLLEDFSNGSVVFEEMEGMNIGIRRILIVTIGFFIIILSIATFFITRYGNTPGRMPFDEVVEIMIYDTRIVDTVVKDGITYVYANDEVYNVEVEDCALLFDYLRSLKFPLQINFRKTIVLEINLGSTMRIFMKMSDGSELKFLPTSSDEMTYINTQLKWRTHYNADYDENEYYKILEEIIEKGH
ncbi:hypothetical protein RI065_04130 [Mycoplasmatota bacterium zrk1]